MKIIKWILLLLLVSVVSNSCDKEKLVGEYYFTPEMRAKIPFKGYETIIFKTDSTGLIELNAANRQDTIYKSPIDKYETDYILWESDNIYFSNQKYKMNLNMNRYVYWHEPTGISFYFTYIDSNYMWGGGFRVFLPDSSTTVLDSMLINGSWIHEVYFDTLKYAYNQPYPHELQVIPIKSYYSTTLGIVKVDFSDGSTWELKEVIW